MAPEIKDRAVNHYEQRRKGEPFPASYATRVLYKGGQEKELMVANAGLIRYRGRPAIMTVAFDPEKAGEEAGTPRPTSGARGSQGNATR
jgi:hypothetical protein